MSRNAIPGLAALALLLTAGALWAECETCRYTDRGDRFEGTENQQVSGGSLDLLAVQYKTAQSGPPATADKLHLYFWLPGPTTPTIEVREPSRNYLMHPVKKPFTAGLQEFAWPRNEVVGRLGIDPSRLYSKISNREETLYYPAFLSGGAPPQAGGRYVFVFRSGAGIDATCTISREEGGQMVPVRKWVYTEDLGGTLPIEWDGRDDQGKTVLPGTYQLRLRGDLLAESVRPLNETVSFVHYGRFN